MTLPAAQRSSGEPAAPRRVSRRGRWLVAAGTTALLAGLACGGEALTGGSDASSDSSAASSSAATNGTGGTGGGSSNSSSTNTASTSAGTRSSSSSGSTSSTAAGSTGGGSTSGIGGGSTSGTGGSGTGGSGTGGNGTGGSGGALPDLCSLPFEPGTCEGYFPSYGFNADTGACENFVYGGCDGNDNRFETREACLDICGPGGRTVCSEPTDCVINQGCCGFCGIESVENLEAVNLAYADFNDPECALIDCEYCLPPEAAEQFGARCNAGTCELYDVRESDLSACETNEDCRLRSGLSCCEGCVDGNWVAVSSDFDRVHDALCGSAALPCPPCEPVQPEDLEAICGPEGHCWVSELD